MKRLTSLFRSISLLALLGGSFGLGCSTLPTEMSMPWDKKTEPETPDRILAIWTDTVRMQAGSPGVRGFGGRLFFYKDGETQPVEVKGGATVYVFDADNPDPDQPAAEKKYVWSSAEFENHMSESPLGKSYSLWIPWGVVGGEQRSLSIVTRFEGDNGAVVISQPVVKLLPGKTKVSSESNESGVRHASYIEETTVESNTQRRQTETIDLPPSFYRHLKVDDVETTEMVPASGTEAEGGGIKDFTEGEMTDSEELEPISELESARLRWEERRPIRSQFRRFPAQTTTESQVSTHLPRRSPHPGGWLDGLPPTPRSMARLLPPSTDSDGVELQQPAEAQANRP
ncbi:MAG: hypothetical protein VXZ63_04300 [Planctomycetota bacterium]|nr:hypothetical protein [Planctomycetota bacterium]MEC7597116.1 hypothetical protein [Planctomycetota bacterium]MEC7604879.1 hypothetical protein [Planctomycetota bacterium]MEC7718483.1 hypothetical protein [Planctomycetota bacterium]MEC8160195.1 hypothetical protein [Planctomycetota bacterium]